MLQFAPRGKSLDFGCGAGALVAAARARGLDAYGAETFYGGDRSEDADLARSWGCDANTLREIKNGILDFPDNFFDIVVHNQVFEHVQNLELAAAEIQRVLKPGGMMVGIFPILGVVKEVHLGLPCVHWFKPGPARLAWAKAMRRVGFGFDFWGEGDVWFERSLKFLDEHVCFRTRKQTAAIIEPFFDVKWTEIDWLAFRVPKYKAALAVPGASFFARRFARMVAGVVIEARSRKTAE
jgi:SAM-dependent methyltransferase